MIGIKMPDIVLRMHARVSFRNGLCKISWLTFERLFLKKLQIEIQFAVEVFSTFSDNRYCAQ